MIAHSRATRVYIANLMTQPGETAALFGRRSRAGHLRAHQATAFRLCGDQSHRHFAAPAAPIRVARRRPVDPSFDGLDRMGLPYVTGDFLDQKGVVRHHQARLPLFCLNRFIHRRVKRAEEPSAFAASLCGLAARSYTFFRGMPRGQREPGCARSPLRRDQ